MHLSDFLFFTITLCALAFVGLLSMWEHLGRLTDWEKHVHTRLKNTLDYVDVWWDTHEMNETKNETSVLNITNVTKNETVILKTKSKKNRVYNRITHRYSYKAQSGQDKYVEQYLNFNNGVYVEFGARNGIEHSNTYYFEKSYNWSGVLVEPDKRELKSIVGNRPNAKVYTGVAVCPVGIKHVDFAISSNRGWSGIRDSYDDKRWTDTIIQQKRIPCVDLNTICPPKVDYMTVDTEGSELEILRTFNFTSHNVTIIQVERNMLTPKQKQEEKQLTNFMKTKGYEKIKQIDIGNFAVDCVYKKVN